LPIAKTKPSVYTLALYKPFGLHFLLYINPSVYTFAFTSEDMRRELGYLRFWVYVDRSLEWLTYFTTVPIPGTWVPFLPFLLVSGTAPPPPPAPLPPSPLLAPLPLGAQGPPKIIKPSGLTQQGLHEGIYYPGVGPEFVQEHKRRRQATQPLLL
jgi:hypothetical protein